MSSEEAVHVSLMEVTPTSGKGTLGTWWFLRQARVGLIKPSIQTAARARDEAMSKLFEDGVYANQRLSLGRRGRLMDEMPRLQTGPEKLGRPAL